MSYTPTKDELKIYSRLWKSVEALWTDLYESGMTVKEIREEFKNIMSGDNPMKFMNLLQTVGQKIQNKVDTNELDGEKLVEEATQMMSQMGGLGGGNGGLFDSLLKNAGNLAGMMGGAGGLAGMMGGATPAASTPAAVANPHNSSSNPTRDRLRRKLEKRKQALDDKE